MESSKEINEFEIKLLEESESLLKNTAVIIHPIKADSLPLGYMDESMNIWNTYSNRIPELEDFFSKIYVSKKFLDLPAVTIPVMDVNEIRAIKPQYLKQFIGEIFSLLEKVLNGNGDSDKIAKLINEKTLSSLKKSMVSSSTPEYVKNKDFIKFDNRVVVEANTAYIQTTLLPFLRSSDQEKDNMIKLIDDVKDVITTGIDTLNNYILTISRIDREGKLQNPSDVYKTLFSVIYTYLEASKYLIASILRKEYIYTTVLKEYITLKDQIMDYYPEGEHILHESVLDGSYDFADEDIVINMLDGRSDTTDSVIDRLYRTYKDRILQMEGIKLGDDFHSLIDMEISNSPFDLQLFKTLFAAQETLMQSITILSEQSLDPDLSIDELKNSSHLEIPVTSKYNSLLTRLTDIDLYITSDLSQKEFCVAFLKELSYAKKFFHKFSSNMQGIFESYKELKKDIIRNDNDKYSNHERNNEEIQFLTSFEKDFRLLVLQIGKGYLHRLSMMEDMIKTNEEVLEGPKLIKDEEEIDYLESAMQANMDIEEFYADVRSSYLFESMYNDLMYQKVTASPIVFVEAEQPANNNNNAGQTQQPTTNTNNQKNNSTKPTVNDNGNQNNSQNTQNTNNTNNGNTNENNGDKVGFIKGLLQRIKDFGTKILDKIKGAQAKLKGNLTWLQENKDALLSRSYSNVSINILPYDTSIQYTSVIDDCTNALNNITRNVGRIGKWDVNNINKTMFAKLKLPADVSKPISERLVLALKCKGGKELQTVTVSNGQLKEMVAQMIDFLEYYYNGFEADIEAAITRLNSALDGVERRATTLNVEGADNTLKIMGTNINTLNGAIAEVARDRSNDYMTVLQQLAPNKPKKESKNNVKETENTENTETEKANSSQPTS